MLSLSAQAADAERGQTVAEVRCKQCHHLERQSPHIGPSLRGVYGRAPSISGTPFRLWDAKSLDLWLQNPRAIKPATRMRIPALAQRDRADVIAFLKQNGGQSSAIDRH